jgi:hypothetical protein
MTDTSTANSDNVRQAEREPKGLMCTLRLSMKYQVEGSGGGPNGPQMPGCCVIASFALPTGSLNARGAGFCGFAETHLMDRTGVKATRSALT